MEVLLGPDSQRKWRRSSVAWHGGQSATPLAKEPCNRLPLPPFSLCTGVGTLSRPGFPARAIRVVRALLLNTTPCVTTAEQRRNRAAEGAWLAVARWRQAARRPA